MLVVFSKKQVNLTSLAIFSKWKQVTHSHINQIMQHSIRCVADSVDPDLSEPASEEAG